MNADRSIREYSTNRRTILKSMLAIPLLGTLGTTACVDPTSGSSGSGGLSVLNIGQISNSVAFFPLFIAEEKGYFTDAGLQMGDRPRLGTGAKLAAALRSGSIDIGAGVMTDAFNLAKVDKGAKLVSALVTEYYVDVVTGNNFAGPGADAPLEEKIRALAGKNVGITGPGSGTEALMNYLLGTVGMDASREVTLVNLGSAATAAIGALTAARVDALAFFQPIGQMAETQNVGKIYISPGRGDVPVLKGALHGVAFSSEQIISDKSKQIEAFHTSIGRSLEDIHNDPDGTKELLSKYLNETDEATVTALMDILPKQTPKTPDISEASFNVSRTFHEDSGLVQGAPDYASIVREESKA